MYSQEDFARLVPVPDAQANKYSRGKAVVVAGSAKYPGAACLCAQASQYAGAGYTQVFTDAHNVSLVQQHRPSLVVADWASLDASHLFSETHPGSVVVGPGFDANDASAYRAYLKVLRSVDKPVLIDGGALTLTAGAEGRMLCAERGQRGFITVLTPHAGEAQRLACAARISAEGEQLALQLAQAYSALVVLKGSVTYISDGQRVEAIANGSAVLAKAGTGDVLAGVIGGLLAQGVNAFDAAALGVYVHAEAGNLAAQKYGMVSACAEEVLAGLPDAFKRLTSC